MNNSPTVEKSDSLYGENIRNSENHAKGFQALQETEPTSRVLGGWLGTGAQVRQAGTAANRVMRRSGVVLPPFVTHPSTFPERYPAVIFRGKRNPVTTAEWEL